MSGLLNVSEMGALALHSILEVAKREKRGETGWTSTTVLADALAGSRHTLHKVVKRLVKAGLLESARGPMGGVKMALPPEQIPLIAVIEAVDGSVRPGGCLFSRRLCTEDSVCQFCGITLDLEKMVRGYFSDTTIAQLLDRLAERGELMPPRLRVV